MAHEFESGIVAGEAAWHGLAKVLTPEQARVVTEEDVDRLCAEAGVGWVVELEKLYNERGVQLPIGMATVRSDKAMDDPERYLGVVGERYTPIQNRELVSVMRALQGEGGVELESLMSLRCGRIVCGTARCGEMQVKGDKIQKYLLVKTTHDASGVFEVLYTPVRVVCMNTLTAALEGNDYRYTCRHTKGAAYSLEDIRRALTLSEKYFGQAQEALDGMANRQVSDRFVRAFLEALMPTPRDGKVHTRNSNNQAEVWALFQGGRQGTGLQKGGSHEAVVGTEYGLYNALAEWVEHRRTVRPGDRKTLSEARLESAVWGSGADLRQKAMMLFSKRGELEKAAALVPATN